MDKILKSLKKLWRYKERLVLIVLLGFLGYNVYRIFVPKPEEPVLPTVPGDPPVAKLPDPRLPDAPGTYRTFTQRNPFSYYSDAEIEPGSGLTPEQAGISLEGLQEGIGGKWRAKLRTTASKWYDEGDSFEEFRVEEIDPVERRVVVYAERFARTVTLTLDEE